MEQRAGQPKSGRSEFSFRLLLWWQVKPDSYFIVLHCDAARSLVPLYILHLCWRHEQIVDTIQVSGVEKTDFDLASATLGGLKYFDLRA